MNHHATLALDKPITPLTSHGTAIAFTRMRAVKLIDPYLPRYFDAFPDDQRIRITLPLAAMYAGGHAYNDALMLAQRLAHSALDDARRALNLIGRDDRDTIAVATLIAEAATYALAPVVDPTAVPECIACIQRILALHGGGQ